MLGLVNTSIELEDILLAYQRLKMEIEEIERILDDLASHFASKYSKIVKREQIFDALVLLLADEHGFEWRGDLWNLHIEYDEALKILSDFDFGTLQLQIETEEDVIASDLLIQSKVRFKAKGLTWVIHKYDADPFPSNPHAHQLDNNLKLDLSNGKCYKKKKLVDTFRRKDLIAIREAAAKVFDGELPPLAF